MEYDPRTRLLHFVRHGQYAPDPEVFGGVLTDLGRRQAEALAEHLADWPIQRVWTSDMNRAVETGAIITARLPKVMVSKRRLLREMLPSIIPSFSVPTAKRRADRARLERIPELLFKRSNTVRHELVVVHGNLIRAVVCQQLKAPSRAWLTMDIHHCSLTTFRVDYDRQVRLVCFNERGHLPPELHSEANAV